MGLQEVEIRGFRSLKHVTWRPEKLNIVIGPNGSGKSNFLRAIAMLQQGATGGLPNQVLRQGGIGPLLWDGESSELSWRIKTDPVTPGLNTVKSALTYELVLRRLGATSSYRVEMEQLASYAKVEALEAREPFKFLRRDPHRAVTFDQQQHGFAAHEDSVPDDQTLLSLVAGPFGNTVILGFRDRLASWGIYHDLHVDQQATIRQSTIARLEKRVSPDGQNLVRVLHTLYSGDREFKKSLDSAMRAAFGTDFEELVFPPAADQQVQLRLRWKSLRREQSALDLSDGTIRFLLLFTILASPNPGDLIAIDEPEVGLHPGMLPIIAELAMDASRKTQVILTTHSPELLDAFGEDPPTTTVAQWTNGETCFSTIEWEKLKLWLKKYRLGEMLRSGELEALA